MGFSDRAGRMREMRQTMMIIRCRRVAGCGWTDAVQCGAAIVCRVEWTDGRSLAVNVLVCYQSGRALPPSPSFVRRLAAGLACRYSCRPAHRAGDDAALLG